MMILNEMITMIALFTSSFCGYNRLKDLSYKKDEMNHYI